jgi:integrase/recombinase XerD
MVIKSNENPLNCGSQNEKAKSQKARLVARIVRLMRQAGLGYDDWRYASRRVRKACDLRLAKKPKKLPRVLAAEQFRQFYRAVDDEGGKGPPKPVR